MGVAIERRESFGATGREAISAQDIDFLDVATDEDSEGGIANDVTINFDDVEGEIEGEANSESEADETGSEICNEDEAIDC